MKAEDEIWRPIRGYEDIYELSSVGRVRSWVNTSGNRTKKPSYKKPTKINRGYLIITLHRSGERRRFYLHRLIADTFIRELSDNDIVCHLNDIKTDNSIGNLYIGTHNDNMRHKVINGKCVTIRGEDHVNSKLTKNEVLDIRNKRGVVLQKDLAKKYNVSKQLISRIQRNERWSYL